MTQHKIAILSDIHGDSTDLLQEKDIRRNFGLLPFLNGNNKNFNYY